MKETSKKVNESEANHTVNTSKCSYGKLKENSEKKIQKQNVTEYSNKNSMILNNIKSEYTIKILFSLLNEKIKLQSIKYNKRLQKINGINLINYKFFRGRYIKYEVDLKGKEYDFYDNLLFEGEFLNGERNGKGKEYYHDGRLQFEGEYLNGKRNGKGKKYD